MKSDTSNDRDKGSNKRPRPVQQASNRHENIIASPSQTPQCTSSHILPTDFKLQCHVKEAHKLPIYCVSWSNSWYRRVSLPQKSEAENDKENKEGYGGDENLSLTRCFATCAGNYVTVYEVCDDDENDNDDDRVRVVQNYEDVDVDEQFYVCAFSHGDDVGVNEKRRSHWLCCAGSRGVVKVLDLRRRFLHKTLSGHGDEIYDLKFAPMQRNSTTNSNLILTASKDESVRLWDLMQLSCLAIFAGHKGHRDSVLSVSFHPSGNMFASAGMDTFVRIWDLPKDAYDFHSYSQHDDGDKSSSSQAKTEKKTAFVQLPRYRTHDAHNDYVDCVMFVGNLLLSKSISNVILLWKPDETNNSGASIGIEKDMSNTTTNTNENHLTPLREFVLENCEVWYVRFHTDPDCRLLAIGNTAGNILVFEIDDVGAFRKKRTLKLENSERSVIRMVSFSPDGDCILASCENSTVWKWDAVY